MQNPTNPIIVCGAARSGTTFVLNLLNSHPDITLSDEFFIYKAPTLIDWIKELGQSYSTYSNRGHWSQRKAQIVKAIWYLTSEEDKLRAGLGSRRWGNKTPGSELYIDFYEDVFEASPPHYIYCMRNPAQVFLSVRNMPWGKNAHLAGQIKRYCQSVHAIEEFQNRHQDRVTFFHIDKIGPAYADRKSKVVNLLNYLGEKYVNEVDAYVEQWKKAHSTQQVRRRDLEGIIADLPDQDLDGMRRHPELKRILKDYGYEI